MKRTLSTHAPEETFVSALGKMSDNDLVIFRQATGKPLGDSVAAYDLFCDLFRPIRRRAPLDKWACYLVATLYPWHPVQEDGVTLAAALRRVAQKQKDDHGRFERRALSLLASRGAALDASLLESVRLLAREGIPLDWRQLLKDLSRWYEPNQPTQSAWAQDYFIQ